MAIKWVEFPNCDLEVNGLSFFSENSPHLYRLPLQAQTVVRDDVWNCSKSPSGGRIRFATDSSQLHVRFRVSEAYPTDNMCRFGQMGLDADVNGQFWNIICPRRQTDIQEVAFFSQLDSSCRQICIYLPLYEPIEILAFGTDDNASLFKPAPFKIDKPVVFYGSSITQGGCASRPSLSYTAVLARTLGIDFVNLGFSGQGKGDPEIATIMSKIPACCYVLDFAQNLNNADELREVYLPFLKKIKLANLDVPVVCITPIFCASELYDSGSRDRYIGLRQVIREAVRSLKAESSLDVTLVEGTSLLGAEMQLGLVDGLHPNDLGFLQIAKKLESTIMLAVLDK